jgi:hypothetical protein
MFGEVISYNMRTTTTMTTNMMTDTVTAQSSVEEIAGVTLNPQKLCRVYVQKWKTYKAWVNSTDGVSPTQNSKYLSQEIVNKHPTHESWKVQKFIGDILQKC